MTVTSTLLLNASYEPLRIITRRRAVSLVFANKAEVIHESEDEMRSAHASFKIPTVIRLRRFVRVPYRARIPLNRKNLVARDKGICQYCGKTGNTIDHVIPRSRGGLHRWENVVLACTKCNATKGDQFLPDLGWELLSKPFAPQGTFWLLVGIVDLDPTWEPYLAA